MRRWFTEPRTMVSSDHRSCGRGSSEGSSGSPSGGTGSGTDGSVVAEQEFVTRRTLSGAASCRAVAAPQAAAVGAPSQLGRRPRRTGSVVWRTRVRPRRIHPSQIRCRRTASLRSPLISSDHSCCGQSSPSREECGNKLVETNDAFCNFKK